MVKNIPFILATLLYISNFFPRESRDRVNRGEGVGGGSQSHMLKEGDAKEYESWVEERFRKCLGKGEV